MPHKLTIMSLQYDSVSCDAAHKSDESFFKAKRSDTGSNMKVLHVVQSLKGGPASYFDETIPHQIARYGSENITLVVPADDLQYLSEATRQAQIRTFPSRARSVKSLMALHSSFREALDDFEPDILHLHSSFAGAVCRSSLVFSAHSPRVIYCSHGWAFDRGEKDHGSLVKRFTVAIEKMLAVRTDLIINISEADQRSALGHGIGAGKSVVVHNGVAECDPPQESRLLLQERLGMDPTKINALFVGRFDHQKGFDLLIDAFRHLDPVRYHLHAIGDFVVSDCGTIKEAARDMNHINFLGWKQRDELPPYFAAADVVIMPSRWEGFGLVAAEAMRMQTPVLATSVGALPELVKDRVCGRLIASASADELVHVLLEENKADWRRYGQRARIQFLENFTSARLNESLSRLYAQLTQGSQTTDFAH